MRILYNIMQVYTYTSSWQCSVHCFRLAGKVNVLNAPAGDGRSTAQQRGGWGGSAPHNASCDLYACRWPTMPCAAAEGVGGAAPHNAQTA